MTLQVMVNDPHFQYQLRESQDAFWCKFGNSVQIRDELLRGKPNFLEF